MPHKYKRHSTIFARTIPNEGTAQLCNTSAAVTINRVCVYVGKTILLSIKVNYRFLQKLIMIITYQPAPLKYLLLIIIKNFLSLNKIKLPIFKIYSLNILFL